VGVVVSDKADKTVTISIERQVRHPRYFKYVRRSHKLTVHDPENKCVVGDTIRVAETRPLSKTKRWRLVEILRRAE
jgi:small subunit ribosomal protein S17